ncbi:hypothetical protein OG426_55420 (plasmid) [Streptomyces canus]|uniref:hypothetical protein n=1 Tax=Streptomyces canus TaxID=58343 RepID=UPI002F90FBCF|nr:hypothetical protein OG426_55420 [Streptomyces canus]
MPLSAASPFARWFVPAIHVQVQLLADQDTVATATDCQELRVELVGADTSFAPDAAGAITEVVNRLDAAVLAAIPAEQP